MNTTCANCKKMLYRTDSCKGVSGKCARTDGGSKVMSGGSSAVERQPSKLGVEGSTPSPRSKPIVGRPKDGPTKKSTAARMDVQKGAIPPAPGTLDSRQAGTQAPPVDRPKRIDTRKGDRHRADYWKTYQRPDRAAKAAKEPK